MKQRCGKAHPTADLECTLPANHDLQIFVTIGLDGVQVANHAHLSGGSHVYWAIDRASKRPAKMAAPSEKRPRG